MQITWFPTVLATDLQRHEIDWLTLVYNIKHPQQYPNKASLPLIKLATFGDMRSPKGSYRFDANVIEVHGLEGDYDGGELSLSAAALLLELAGVKAVLYTSPSHTVDKPRWRVLCELSRPYAPSERRALMGRLNGVLGGVLSPESFTLSQTYYFGAVSGAPYECVEVPGAYIDTLNGLPEVLPAPVAGQVREQIINPLLTADLDELRSALSAISADERDTWISIGQALAGLGEQGYQLWAEWSATSAKHDPAVDLQKWSTFTGDRTGYQSIFAKAQRAGWINPRSVPSRPVDYAGVGFGAGQGGASGGVSGLADLRCFIDLFDFPDRNVKQTKSVSTTTNLRYLLQRYGITAYYDQILKQDVITIPDKQMTGDLSDNAKFSYIESIIARNELPASTINHLVEIYAENTCNPIKDWITSKPWDGITRLPLFYNTVHVQDDKIQYRNDLLRMWLVQCVAAMDGAESSPIKHKQRKYECVLTFQSGQGCFKTSWVRALVPDEYREYVVDGMILNLDEKDSIKKALSAWIVELGELEGTFRKSDISKLKAFMSNESDSIRLPYERKPNKYQRRTSFFASVNDEGFLVDDTGNRRFWPLAIDSANPQHNLDMQQVWAEVWSLYCAGAPWWPRDEVRETIEQHHAAHEISCPVESKLLDYFNMEIHDESQPVLSCTKILEIMGNIRPSVIDMRRTGAALRKYGFERVHGMYGKGYRVTVKPKHPPLDEVYQSESTK